MEKELETIGLDGDYEIIYSKSFNIYEDKLTIPDFLGKKFIYIFEKTEPIENQKDINIIWSDNISTITLSKKFRNTLGSGTVNKIKILKMEDGKDTYMSIYGQDFGEGRLNVVINFYLK